MPGCYNMWELERLNNDKHSHELPHLKSDKSGMQYVLSYWERIVYY